jgi:TP901 family phage tail tape measure protein
VAGAESFTVLAILEARDAASEIFAKVDESLDKFSETAKGAADSARDAGVAIDEALGRDVEVSDRLETATARLAAAQSKGADAARALTDAEKELRDAQASAAGGADDDKAATARLIEADKALADAQRDAAAAARSLKDAEAGQLTALKASADAGDENAAAQVRMKESSDASGISLGSAGKVAGIMALGLGVAAAVMVKAAGNFQDSTTHLVTDAGESARNLGMVQAGILSVSTATGQSASDITNAMYHIESSGFHAASGLAVLKTVAEGARVGGADLDTTSKALVGTLTAYYGTSLTAAQATKDSTSLMNQLVETVGSGDMRMQDLASSLSAVTPVAAAAHISFAQVGGAIATMTAQGMSAQQTTQDLAHFIRSMQAPTLVSSNEMKALGLNANSLSQNLGTTGLAGTIDEMRNAILRNTSGGSVMLGYLKEMSPAAQSLANQILSGSITTGALTTAVKGLNPEQAHLITMFKSSATSATGLKQTYTEAMSKMTGGATGLNVALMLSGKHMVDLTKNTAAIAARAKDASGNVQGWSAIQGTFNFKVSQAKTGIENTGIAIGTALLPAVTAVLSAVTKVIIPIAEWTARHKTLTEVIFASVTAIAAVIAMISLARKAFGAVKGAVDAVRATMKALGLTARETGKDQETSATQAAAVQEEQSAEASAAMEADAGEAAAANETAAAESSGSWATSAGQMITSAAKWVAQSAVKAAQAAASYAVAAAQAAARWAVAGAQMIAQGAIWVAQTVAKVAVVVGSNIAAAATTAAAWIAANAAMLLGIGLIVVAVVAAVALIVTHWRQISDFAKKAFDDVLHVVETVIGWVRSHWPLLLAILTGPIGLAALFVVDHYKQILRVIDSAISWVRSHWPLLLEILTGPIGFAVTWIVQHFDQLRHGAASLVDDFVHFFTTLPGRILSGLGNIGSMLFGAGEKIIQGLISGVENMLGSLGSTMSSVASTITSFLPFSPAKRGPLSGGGDPSNSGRSIAGSLAKGLLAGRGGIEAAAGQLTGPLAGGELLARAKQSVAAIEAVMDAQKAHQEHIWHVLHMEHLQHLKDMGMATGAGSAGLPSLTAAGGGASAGAGSGGPVININVYGNTVMSESDVNILVNRVGKAVATKILPQAGVRVRMG